MIKNEHGITLIEVLGSVVILSLIGSIIWNIFFQGYNFSQEAISKNSMQQEANFIINDLTKIHQTAKQYEITSSGDSIQVTFTKKDDSIHTQKFNHPNMRISAVVNPSGQVIPKLLNGDVTLTITIKDSNNLKNEVITDALLYRLKED
jgi:type II secretory pathway pseudopilin PulG